MWALKADEIIQFTQSLKIKTVANNNDNHKVLLNTHYVLDIILNTLYKNPRNNLLRRYSYPILQM